MRSPFNLYLLDPFDLQASATHQRRWRRVQIFFDVFQRHHVIPHLLFRICISGAFELDVASCYVGVYGREK